MCCIRICTSLTCKMCILRTNFLKKLTKLFLANGICELCTAIQEGQIEMRTVWFIILGILGQKSILNRLIGLEFWAWYGYRSEMKPKFPEKVPRIPRKNVYQAIWRHWPWFRIFSDKTHGIFFSYYCLSGIVNRILVLLVATVILMKTIQWWNWHYDVGD